MRMKFDEMEQELTKVSFAAWAANYARFFFSRAYTTTWTIPCTANTVFPM